MPWFYLASCLRRRLLSAFLRIALDTGECRALASGTQDLDNGYRAVRRYTKSRERPVRLIAHCRHPSIRCLYSRGQQSATDCFTVSIAGIKGSIPGAGCVLCAAATAHKVQTQHTNPDTLTHPP